MRLGLRLRATELTDFDAVVLGGGPAGCAAAILLARQSHRVALVRPAEPPAGALAVSVPPSARRVLEELGASEVLDGTRAHPNLGNEVHWAGAPPRAETYEHARRGIHVDRTTLEERLAAVADRQGVHVMTGVSARRPAEVDGGWRVRCDGSAGTNDLSARWVVDATGRHGVLARHEGRVPDRATTTLAVVRRWRRAGGWPDPGRYRTFIESWPEGWAWSVPLAEDLRCYTVMIDQRTADVDGADLDTLLERALDRTSWIGGTRDGAEPEGAAWACPASLYTADHFARPGLVLAGDAGSFIDPLSSFGVKKALSSGWLAGIVVNTSLMDAARTDDAVTFFDERERQVYRRYRRASEPFFAQAARAYGTAYWVERARAAHEAGRAGASVATRPGAGDGAWGDTPTRTDATSDPVVTSDPNANSDPDAAGEDVPEALVRAAWEAIRTRPRLDARRGRSLRTIRGPGVVGHRIVRQERLATDRWPRGLRYVRGVDLIALVDGATAHDDVSDAWTAYNEHATAVPLPDYLTALATAFAATILEHDDGGA